MKTLNTLLLSSGLALLVAGCGPDVENKHRFNEATEAVQAYLHQEAFNPESISLEPSSDLLDLDTIANPAILQGKRDYKAMIGAVEAVNVSGEKVSQELVFFLTRTYECVESQPIDEFSEAERQWLKAHAF